MAKEVCQSSSSLSSLSVTFAHRYSVRWSRCFNSIPPNCETSGRWTNRAHELFAKHGQREDARDRDAAVYRRYHEPHCRAEATFSAMLLLSSEYSSCS